MTTNLRDSQEAKDPAILASIKTQLLDQILAHAHSYKSKVERGEMSRENAGLLLEKFGYGIAAAVHIIGLHIDYADLTREVDRLVAEIDPKAHD